MSGLCVSCVCLVCGCLGSTVERKGLRILGVGGGWEGT